MAVAPPAPARRTWPQRLLITCNALLIAMCLVVTAVVGFLYSRFGDVEKIAFAKNVLTQEDEDDPGEPENWLLVGSDTRDFVEGGQDQASFGGTDDVVGQRADTIIVLRIDPRTEQAAMLSIPRDLYVTVDSTGDKDRINSTFADGPDQLIETIKENFGIPIHHYAQVNFAGFQGLVEAVGGVEVYFPSPSRDRMSGLDVPAGCITLNGDQALAYVRSRHFQYQENGRWRSDPSGDIGRISRQQDFIRRSIREALSKGLTNPARLNELASVGIDNVAIDEGVGFRDIVELGSRFRSLDPASIDMATLPAVNARVNGASVLRLVADEAQPIIDRFVGVRPPADQEVQPSEVRIRVLNGTGTVGQAGQAATGLEDARFVIAGLGNGSSGNAQTVIRYGTGQQAKAELVARYLEGPSLLVAEPDMNGVDLELTTGDDFAGVRATPTPASAAPPPTSTTTSTTAPQAGAPAPPC